MFLQIVLLIILSLLSFGCYLWMKARKYRHFRGNLGFPVIGNLYQCLNYLCHLSHPSFFELMERTIGKYGKVSTFWYSNKVALAIADPFIVEKLIYQPMLEEKPDDVYSVIRKFMSNTFALPTGKEWKLRKKELNNHLRKQCLESYHSTFLNGGNKAVEVLSQKTKQFDCLPDMKLLMMEVAAKSLYGLDLTLTDHALHKEIETAHTIIAAALSNPIIRKLVSLFGEMFEPFKRERKLMRTLHEGVLQKLNVSNTDKDKGNLASTIAFRNAGRNALGRELFLELTEVMYASSLNVGNSLAAALVYLATVPEVQEKVWQEQHDIFGDSEREPTVEDIEKMDYLERFFKEVCRFVSPPFSPKRALADIEIDGIVIPKGTTINICSRRIRFDPEFWINPESFDPDRHLPENIAKVPKCANMSFGYGLRYCPGVAYAVHAFKVIISSVVRKLEIQSTMKFEEIKYSAVVTMDIITGYNISVKKRNVFCHK